MRCDGFWGLPTSAGSKSARRPKGFGINPMWSKAPGEGQEVANWLDHFLSIVGFPEVSTTVTGIDPNTTADGRHRVTFGTGLFADFPIVVNCLGLGAPRP